MTADFCVTNFDNGEPGENLFLTGVLSCFLVGGWLLVSAVLFLSLLSPVIKT